jgi:hypothetical protein
MDEKRLREMAEAEDEAGCVSAGGMASDLGMLGETPQIDMACPRCQGSGKATITEASKRAFLEGLWQFKALEKMPNAELAEALNEVQNYLRFSDLSPLVFRLLDEIWWRLHAAHEPVEETHRKIEALRNDPAWLES